MTSKFYNVDAELFNADWPKQTVDVFDEQGELVKDVGEFARLTGMTVEEVKRLPAYVDGPLSKQLRDSPQLPIETGYVRLVRELEESDTLKELERVWRRRIGVLSPQKEEDFRELFLMRWLQAGGDARELGELAG